MSLIVIFTNDGTGTDESANYNVAVYVTVTPTKLKTIDKFSVHGHDRSDNFKKLLALASL